MIDGEEVHFIGKTSRVKQREKGTKWFFVGPKIGANILAEGAIMYHDQKTEVGVITGAIWSPSLKKDIAMAHFLMQQATGGRIWAEIYALRELHYQKLMMLAHVVEHPFFNHSGRRATSPGRF